MADASKPYLTADGVAVGDDDIVYRVSGPRSDPKLLATRAFWTSDLIVHCCSTPTAAVLRAIDYHNRESSDEAKLLLNLLAEAELQTADLAKLDA